MKNLRCREDEAAWKAWVDGVRKQDSCMALMRRIINAVDLCRALDARRDKDEASREG